MCLSAFQEPSEREGRLRLYPAPLRLEGGVPCSPGRPDRDGSRRQPQEQRQTVAITLCRAVKISQQITVQICSGMTVWQIERDSILHVSISLRLETPYSFCKLFSKEDSVKQLININLFVRQR